MLKLQATLLLLLCVPGEGRLEEHRGGGAVAFSPDGRRLLSHGSEGFHVWDLAEGRELDLEKAVTAPRIDAERQAAFTRDGKEVVLFDSGRLHTWTLETGARVRLLRGPEAFLGGSLLSPEGAVFAAYEAEAKALVKLTFHASAREESRAVDIPEGEINSMAFSPLGDRFAASGGRGREGWVRVWETSGRERGVLRIQPPGASRSVIAKAPSGAFSPDGKLLVVTRTAGTHIPGRPGGASLLQVWDVESGQEHAALEGHQGEVWQVAFAPDGARLAAWGPSELILWSLEQKKPLLIRAGVVHAAAFDAAGAALAVIASADPLKHQERTVSVLDLASGRDRFVLPTAYYHAAVFSPDGARLAVSSDRSIRLLDALTGEPLKPGGK